MYLENKKPIEKLRLALTTGAIKAYYQPEIDFSLPNWLGFEALSRWFDPDLGEVSPAQFIPWAQEHGLLAQLTLMQIRQMEQDAPKLLSQQKHISLGLNLSPSLLGHHEIWTAFEKATHVTRQWPITWEVELSESEAIHDFGLARHFLRELQQMGIKVLLDDFGTGWSNPTRLEMLDIDGIKVDAIFVREMDQPGSKDFLTRAHALAQEHQLNLTIEGVETDSQAATLRHMGYSRFQGWLYSKAIPVDLAKSFRVSY